MDIQKRLKEIRLERGLTQKELANKIGKSYQIYQTWENGSRNPKEDNLRQLADALEVSYEYLTDTEILPIYQKLSSDKKKKTIIYAESQLELQKEDNKIIQFKKSLISYEVEEEQALSAGRGLSYTSSLEKEVVYWDKEVKYDRAVWIKGHSMEPDYEYGQVALIRYLSLPEYDGQVCAVDNVERGMAYIKCVNVEKKGFRLVSINDATDELGNPLFLDIFLPFSENPRIIGKVVAAFTPIDVSDAFY
ncbi:XRE family transcriptional regulator [Lactococcus allomyrinae]|uniref:Helix-turn-helix domain-containing protein n=1 Tax=Lactococcus allomyrinae TaxID=2419773 RepID=A0A387BDM8_9LACT|nr:XRE family transcriptional regulator [Lactococcus allomyrinae]AYG02055.1 helix-turn-helix domain-containing protein [Lactococcus allomyrinae]